MASNKNQRIFSTDPEFLKRLLDEYTNYVGRYCELDLTAGCLTIYARTPIKSKKKKNDKEERNKRAEKFERRS